MDKQISMMSCLDMRNGVVVKGVHFADIYDAGDDSARRESYSLSGKQRYESAGLSD